MASGVLGVQLSADAYLVCLTHALSAEKEEVMEVLLGEVCSHLFVCLCGCLCVCVRVCVHVKNFPCVTMVLVL